METNKTSSHNYQLELLKSGLSDQTYPGYPTTRLCLGINQLQQIDGRLIIPDGPWTTSYDSPNSDKQFALTNQGFKLDSKKRPLHPWFEAMIEDSSIGVLTGRGSYWHWGPNQTVDSAVVQAEHLLMVRRKDTGLWALPGGFIDNNETVLDAAEREVREETGIILNSTPPVSIYRGPVADIRLTANAWPETNCLFYNLEGKNNFQPVGMDDASEAAWVPVEEALVMPRLFGSHRMLVNLALKEYGIYY